LLFSISAIYILSNRMTLHKIQSQNIINDVEDK
jgi:hypothetical protein